MKRFLLFSGYRYYPRGGWSDFRKDYATQEEAAAAGVCDGHEWFEVIDLESGREVENGPIVNPTPVRRVYTADYLDR